MSDDMGPLPNLPKIDPRDPILRRARLELQDAMISVSRNHDLSAIECISLLTQELSWYTQQVIRDERKRDRRRKG